MNKMNHFCLQRTYNLVCKRRLSHTLKHIAYKYVCTYTQAIKLQQRKQIRYRGNSYGNLNEILYKIKDLYSSKMSMSKKDKEKLIKQQKTTLVKETKERYDKKKNSNPPTLGLGKNSHKDHTGTTGKILI